MSGLEIRATHHAGFRSGTWAVLTGVEWWNERPCFLVQFPDGTADRWAVYDSSDPYEFRALSPAADLARWLQDTIESQPAVTIRRGVEPQVAWRALADELLRRWGR